MYLTFQVYLVSIVPAFERKWFYVGFSGYLVLQMTLEFENPSTVSKGGVFRGRRNITELVGIFPTTETVDRVGLQKKGFFRVVDENSSKPRYRRFLE
jgi:hypothetical protein